MNHSDHSASHTRPTSSVNVNICWKINFEVSLLAWLFAKNSDMKRYSELALSIRVRLKLLNNCSNGYLCKRYHRSTQLQDTQRNKCTKLYHALVLSDMNQNDASVMRTKCFDSITQCKNIRLVSYRGLSAAKQSTCDFDKTGWVSSSQLIVSTLPHTFL